VDDSKWEGLESLDVGSKFLMFEKGGSQDRDTSRVASDRSNAFSERVKAILKTLINTFTGP
jgi:hypothetical protein